VAADYLASDQVQGLDAIGTYVDLGDSHIAYKLFLTPFADKTIAAQHLLTMNRGFHTHISQKSLGYWRKYGYQFLGTLAYDRVLTELCGIQLYSYIAGEGPTALVQRFHG